MQPSFNASKRKNISIINRYWKIDTGSLPQQQRVIRYYNSVQKSYDQRWMNKVNLAMHLGFWDKTTTSLHDALINENRYVAEALDLNNDDTVLDAGCGVGGTAIWIAENYGIKVVGINIVEDQIRAAKKYAKERAVQNLVNFAVSDYIDTGFEDGSFTKVYAIESACHSSSKQDFLCEAYRLLGKPGKLVIVDAFIAKDNLSKFEKKWLRDWYDGWVCPDLERFNNFRNMLKEAGFERIRSLNVTKEIMPSSKILYKHCSRYFRLKRFLAALRLISPEAFGNTKASVSQYHLFKNNVVIHALFIAEKV